MTPQQPYAAFLNTKRQLSGFHGFDPTWMPDSAFPFQRALIEWACRKGRAAIFADCGLGKTLMQLTWAQNVAKHTGKRVLILTPLAVSRQTVREAEKFDIECTRSNAGELDGQIIATNYERLHKFNASDFGGVVCDESGILKNHSGATRNAVIEFTKATPFRLLASATPAPNDVTELGNSVEALGVMRRVEMLAKYFIHDSADTGNWRLKGHAVDPFWAFVASWARAVRHPRDIGFDQGGYDLPPLEAKIHIIKSQPLDGMLFPIAARTLDEQRAERRETIDERCGKVADVAAKADGQFVAWCSLNSESERLADMIPNSVELSGADSDEEKEEKVEGFSTGKIETLITKPTICSHGVNWQACCETSFFPSHSHEQFYQSVRRFWRFGQHKKVTVHVVASEAESCVLDNLQRKEREASAMFDSIVANMRAHQNQDSTTYNPQSPIILPSWIK